MALLNSNLPKYLWSEAVQHATYVLNRCPTTAIEKGKTPAEIWYDEKPDFNKLHPFGHEAYVKIPKQVRKGKLEARSKKMKMVGYTTNGFRFYDDENGKVINSRDVQFLNYENVGIRYRDEVSEENNKNKNEGKEEETAKDGPANEVMQGDVVDGAVVGGEQQTNKRVRSKPKYLDDYEVYSDATYVCLLNNFIRSPKNV